MNVKVLLPLLSLLSITQFENVTGTNYAMKDLTSSLQKFTANLYNEVAKRTNDSENIFFSPLSIAEALGMVMAGAQENTHLEIARALQLHDYTQENYNNQFKRLYNKVFNMTKKHTKSQALMANRAFVQEDYPVKHNYTHNLKNYFDAGVDLLDFSDSASAAARINEWVSEKTGGMIRDLINSRIDPLTRIILVNALYFQAQWKKQFLTKGYHDQMFHTPSGPIRVPFMGRNGHLKYIRDQSTTQVLLPYDEGEAHMLIVMPDEAIKTFTEKNQEKFLNFFHSINKEWKTSYNTEISMPMFELEQTLDMTEILTSMGVQDLFDGQRANLSGVSDESLHVSMFTHKAKITVNDKGTKAAAVSAIAALARSLPPEPIVIDKPFLFAIYRRRRILFFGRVSSPVAPASLE